MTTDAGLLVMLLFGLGLLSLVQFYRGLTQTQAIAFVAGSLLMILTFAGLAFEFLSIPGRERRKRIQKILEIPKAILVPSQHSVYLGKDLDLKIPVYLPDKIRSRHVHILGATGSGKTESVILNFLKQDVARGLGSIILDAKGDASFLRELEAWVPKDRLKVFDLSSPESLSYDPLESGSALEAAQRLFASLIWSEEYYKSKAYSALQRLFEVHRLSRGRNPNLLDIDHYLQSQDAYTSAVESLNYSEKLSQKDYLELSSLRDQVHSLTIGHLGAILSAGRADKIKLEDAQYGQVIYFRLQSLLSQQLVGSVGKLVINHLSYLAGTAHRDIAIKQEPAFLPTYLDEFASFACPEFADLISKARSAGLALHFSHQSVGDIIEVSPGFMSRIMDNSATKIVLRINDPDSAELLSRSFGTSLYQKITQRVTNAEKIEQAEVLGEGTQREAHQFRASPDLLKTLPTGMGSVLIAHGEDTPHGASTVFKVKFPRLNL